MKRWTSSRMPLESIQKQKRLWSRTSEQIMIYLKTLWLRSQLQMSTLRHRAIQVELMEVESFLMLHPCLLHGQLAKRAVNLKRKIHRPIVTLFKLPMMLSIFDQWTNLTSTNSHCFKIVFRQNRQPKTQVVNWYQTRSAGNSGLQGERNRRKLFLRKAQADLRGKAPQGLLL